MNPGNPAPYRLRATERNKKDVCLKNKGGDIDEWNNWTCADDEKDQEAWFYTADKKLRSAKDGKFLYDYGDGFSMHVNNVGDVWEYDKTLQKLKIKDKNLCMDLWNNECKGTEGIDRKCYPDVVIAPCSDSKRGQTLLATEFSDSNNYDVAQCKRSDQFSFDKSGNFVTNVDPVSDEAKYDCCTKQANQATSKQCGYNYCVNSDTCKNFLNNVYCKKNPLVPLCQSIASNINKATYCKEDPTRLLTDPTCKQVCDNINDGNTNAICEQAALDLCRKNPGKYTQCACFDTVYDSNGNVNTDTKDYKDFVVGLPKDKIPALGSPECWLDKCLSKSKPFSDLFKQNSKKCPQCIITAAITDTTIGGAANIKQSCISNNNQNTTVNSVGDGDDIDNVNDDDDDDDDDDVPFYKQNKYIFVMACVVLMLCSLSMFGMLGIFAATAM